MIADLSLYMGMEAGWKVLDAYVSQKINKNKKDVDSKTAVTEGKTRCLISFSRHSPPEKEANCAARN